MHSQIVPEQRDGQTGGDCGREVEKRRDFYEAVFFYLRGGNTVEHRLDLDEEQ